MPATNCDIDSLINLLQATLCDKDLINLGTTSNMMHADCAKIDPLNHTATMQVGEMSSHAPHQRASLVCRYTGKYEQRS